MNTYYFTYGTAGQPYYGGWTEVKAENMTMACKLFRMAHPDKMENAMNCSWVYNEEEFKQTGMYKEGNFGHRCWERIALSIEKMKE